MEEYTMRRILPLIPLIFVLANAAPGSAKEERACGDAPRTQWLSEDAIKAKGVALGYEVRRVKIEKGCYEAYATDKTGSKVELYFNPVTGEIVSREGED
jgi:hypothetical protein